MAGTPTTKYALPTVLGTDIVKDGDNAITALANAVDAKMVGYSSGLLSARPTSTPGSPGVEGRIYRATDTGQLFMDTGTGWNELTFNQAGFIAGDLKTTARSTAPAGWMMCDGSVVSRTGATAALFAAIGTAYGAGDGSTTFALPNLQGRVPVGRDAAQVEFDTLGEAMGAKTHTLATPELPAHSHADGTLGAAAAGSHSHGGAVTGDGSHNHDFQGFLVPGGSANVPQPFFYIVHSLQAGPSTAPLLGTNSNATYTNLGGTGVAGSGHGHGINADGSHTHDVTGATANAGGGSAHNNIQPSLVVNYMIKL